jgi:transitional endoplasmic reticulum ATPase
MHQGPESLTLSSSESEAQVHGVFEKAQAMASCIILFDELDSIAKFRSDSSSDAGGAGDRVLYHIHTEMDIVQWFPSLVPGIRAVVCLESSVEKD